MCFEREPCFEMHMVIAQDVTYQSLNALGKDVNHTNRLQGEGFSYMKSKQKVAICFILRSKNSIVWLVAPILEKRNFLLASIAKCSQNWRVKWFGQKIRDSSRDGAEHSRQSKNYGWQHLVSKVWQNFAKLNFQSQKYKTKCGKKGSHLHSWVSRVIHF